MKKLIFAFAASLLVSTPALANPTEGVWRTDRGVFGGRLHVQIEECGNYLCGVIVRAFDDQNNENPGYEHLGKKVLWDMIHEADGSYSGRVWAPDENITYPATMELNGQALVLKGCIGGGSICRSQAWTRSNANN